MVESSEVFSGKVKHKGIFDYKQLYSFCYTWLVDKGYLLLERTYSEKIGAEGKEVEIEWECFKKISDYFRFKLKIKWLILRMKDVEVEKDGNKVGMNKGEPEIKVTAYLEKDYESRWEGHPFWKFLRDLYNRYIIRGRIDDYEARVHGEADEFLAQVKAYLALEGKH